MVSEERRRLADYFSYWNVTRGIFLAVVIVLGYFIPNLFILFPLHAVILTRVDHWVHVSPSWIWIYISYYPLLIACLVRDDEDDRAASLL